MCTGFVYKGNNDLYAYNLDISPDDFDYKLVINNNLFAISIKVGSTSYFTHGVNSEGIFAVLPFMNDDNKFVNKKYPRIDLLINKLLKNQISIREIDSWQDTSNIKLGSLHALVASKADALLIEPGLGKKEIDKYQVISNYPLLKTVNDDNPFYGKDRYKFIDNNLSKCRGELSVEDALYLLKYSAQEGKYSTKLSFVYSSRENKVYYCLNRDFDNIKTHTF